ncbi:MAG: SLC13 family permease [Armatimonadota bacterium]|nr:SLC13 family permease [Armatimonadota bacterium]MDR7518233.1 SLC13 family permease [Armatimonadota bacterium]MDR7548657.1 SLC13 family permease [Armatimonadota bacterium]
MSLTQVLTLGIFVVTYALAVSRVVKIAYVSLAAAALLIITRILTPHEIVTQALKWDVLGIYWGFMMVSIAFMDSGVPKLLAERILYHAHTEKHAILYLAAATAGLSIWMENVGVVLMMAPIALEISRRLNSSLFPYMVTVGIASNVVTTVTMVADPPTIILAIETGMKFKDFYWFLGRPGLGTLTVVAVVAALLTLLLQFRGMSRRIDLPEDRAPVTWGATVLFVVAVAVLAFGHERGLPPGIVGVAAGAMALWLNRARFRAMFVEFDWNSFAFIIGIFVVVHSLRATGLLAEFARLLHGVGLQSPGVAMAGLIWIAVAASSFVDNVPFTVLMIPVAQDLARLLGISPWPLLYGMLVGTGSGGNITPVGATANVFACGFLEKHGYKIHLGQYMKISVPFTVVAVGVAHILLTVFWLR